MQETALLARPGLGTGLRGPGPSSHPGADFQRRPGGGGGGDSSGCASPGGTETGALRCRGMSYPPETYHPVFLSPTPSHSPGGRGAARTSLPGPTGSADA